MKAWTMMVMLPIQTLLPWQPAMTKANEVSTAIREKRCGALSQAALAIPASLPESGPPISRAPRDITTETSKRAMPQEITPTVLVAHHARRRGLQEWPH